MALTRRVTFAWWVNFAGSFTFAKVFNKMIYETFQLTHEK